jgi:molecular chaperone DnaJ
MSKDYYKILGVERNATPDEIKKAYRKLAMKHHPDKNDGSVDSEAKFKEAAEAYETLSTPDKKSNYDRFGSANGGGRNPFGGGGFGNMEDIFSNFGDIFGNSFNQRYSGGGQKPQSRGSTLRIKVSLNIDEIIKGASKKLKYKRQDKCGTCSGKGGTDVRSCIPCNGSGQRTVVQNTPFGQIRQATSCPDCVGSGQQVHIKCKDCRGDGTIVKEQTVDVDIPAGVSNGMQLSMNGYGNYVRGGEPGDLHIIIEEERDFSFKRENNNIIVEKTISVIDAIIGSNVKVKTPHGEINVAIEPGTEHGRVIRMNGKGIPDINYGMGDLYIKISVKIPKKIELDEKLALEKLKKSKNFEV